MARAKTPSPRCRSLISGGPSNDTQILSGEVSTSSSACLASKVPLVGNCTLLPADLIARRTSLDVRIEQWLAAVEFIVWPGRLALVDDPLDDFDVQST